MRSLAALLLAALALAGCGATDTDEAASPAPETVTVTETAETQTEPAPVETEPAAECSASGLDLTLPEQDLPEPVAATRQRVFDAAVACDYDALAGLASEEGFTFSFGGGTDPAEHWRTVEASAEEPKPIRALATILTLPVTRNEAGSYAWPSAYTESPTEQDWADLVESGLYDQADVDRSRELNEPYYGYRTAITPEGDWQFFVAGD